MTGNYVNAAIHVAVLIVGEDKLAFKANKVVPHSLQSGAVMALYLGDVPIYTNYNNWEMVQ